MKLSDFNYQLPENLIAQAPASPRDQSRLLILHRTSGRLEHRRFFNIVDYLDKGDVLIINDSKVIPARLIGNKLTGGKVEIFLSHLVSLEKEEEIWECLIKGKHIKVNSEIIFSKKFKAVVQEKINDVWLVKFNCSGQKFQKFLEEYGQVPLPPYIKTLKNTYKKQYQTVYADTKHKGSVAAPTAGLHFTPRLIKELEKKGVIIKKVTLHVGLGTFLPVRVDTIKKHQMHSEWVEVKKEVFKEITSARKRGNKVIAVGTTTVRSLEAAFRIPPTKDFQGWVNIFIYPPYQFKTIDGLITNFHLPESTLLMLVSALAGRQKILKAYKEAVKEKYRFFSFGDAMLIVA